MGATAAITARGLHKSFGALEVLRGVDLEVPAGTVLALLGRNGAGKTTMVRLLTTLLRPDAGTATVAGFDVVSEVHAVRRAISLTGQSAAVDEAQTGQELLIMMARLWGLSGPQARRRSGELLERFDLAASLVAEPAVIFLDEPTTGLDLPSRQTMWAVIAQLARRGVTVFLTTQSLEEADRLADQVAIIDAGAVAVQGTPAELKARVGTERLHISFSDRAACERALALLQARQPAADLAHLSIEVDTDGTATDARALLDAADPAGSNVAHFELRRPTLDDVFLTYTTPSAGAPEKLPR